MPGSCPIPALFCGKQLVFPGFRGDLSTGGGRQILSQFPSHTGPPGWKSCPVACNSIHLERKFLSK